MAESMKGLKRTCRCAEVTKADIGKIDTGYMILALY